MCLLPCRSFFLSPYRPTAAGGDYCEGRAWDDFTLHFEAKERCYTTAGWTTGNCEPPADEDGGCDKSHYAKTGIVNMNASELAYQGAVCDRVMYLARIALDYSRWLAANGGAASDVAAYAESADRMSRYAVVVLADNARTWLHELGHIWLDPRSPTYDTDDLPWHGAHCQFNCCNDVVAEHWYCRVRGALGLPYRAFESFSPDDYAYDAMPAYRSDHAQCSGDEYAVRIWSCDVTNNGDLDQPTYFCSTGCYVRIDLFGFGYNWYMPDDFSWVYDASSVANVCPI